jgi:hypothetical protein
MRSFRFYQEFVFSRFKIYLNLPYQIQRKVKSQFTRDMFTKLSASFKPKKAEGLTSDEVEHVSNLNKLGWSSLGTVISPCEVENLKIKLNNFPLEDRFRPNMGHFSLENVPSDSHVASYVIDDWNQFPEIINIANSDKLLRIAGSYLGCMPTISNLQLWWSFPGHGEAEQAENFHRDVDDWKFLKLFIYLTDVDDDSGPHVYVQKSCKHNRTLPIRRYSDIEIEELFGKQNILPMLARKGEGLLEDTFGFHKGQLAKTKRRLLLQVQYSINPIAINGYEPKVSNFNYDSHVNRLYLKIGK